MINLTAMLIILALFSIFFGYITKDMFIGIGTDFFKDNSIFIHPSHEIVIQTEFAVPTIFKLLPFILTVSLAFTATVGSEFFVGKKTLSSFKLSRFGYNIYGFFNQRFFIELLYNKYITGLVLKLGGQTTKVLDKGSVELLGPYGIEKGLITLSRNIASLDKPSVITSYALYILIGLIFYLLIPDLVLAGNTSILLLILYSLLCFIKISNSSSSKSARVHL